MSENAIIQQTSSFSVAKSIAAITADAKFCGFEIDDGRKIPYNRSGQGVSRATPAADLISAGQLASTPCPSSFWGISMHEPIVQAGYTLVCLDLDTKRSTATTPDIRIKRLAQLAKEQGHLYERSHSMKGAHIWALTTDDKTLPKSIQIGQGQEIEIFGLVNSKRTAVMLTGIEASGTLQIIPSIRNFLSQAGIDPSSPAEPDAPRPQTEHQKVTEAKVSEMLAHIVNADLPYDDWLRVCMAAKTAGGSYEDICKWSASSAKHDQHTFDSKWPSWTDKPEGVGLGTLQRIAYDSGWEPEDRLHELQELKTDHPLARTLELTNNPKPPRMILPGVIGYGVVSIAGQHGVGKTTAVLPLTMIVAGLIQSDLEPKHWRHVVYITEDSEQAQRIITGVCRSLEIDFQRVRERFHLVDAVRLPPKDVALVAPTYKQRYTRTVQSALSDQAVEVLPLVVFDTKSAVFDIENENDASEASAMIAAIKQEFEGLPTWIIGHIAKANFGKTDAASLSSRGSGAVESDANQNAYIVQNEDKRYLVLGKRRFETNTPEIELESFTSEAAEFDEFGEMQEFTLRWALPKIPERTAAEVVSESKAEREKADDTKLRTELLNSVEMAWDNGNPVTARKLREMVSGKTTTVSAKIATLLVEGWLYEVEIPTDIRVHPKKSHYLVRLTDAERREFLNDGVLPVDKLQVPPSLRTPDPLVPAPKAQEPENDQIDPDEEW